MKWAIDKVLQCGFSFLLNKYKYDYFKLVRQKYLTRTQPQINASYIGKFRSNSIESRTLPNFFLNFDKFFNYMFTSSNLFEIIASLGQDRLNMRRIYPNQPKNSFSQFTLNT